jgi:hypothetical protein
LKRKIGVVRFVWASSVSASDVRLSEFCILPSMPSRRKPSVRWNSLVRAPEQQRLRTVTHPTSSCKCAVCRRLRTVAHRRHRWPGSRWSLKAMRDWLGLIVVAPGRNARRDRAQDQRRSARGANGPGDQGQACGTRRLRASGHPDRSAGVCPQPARAVEAGAGARGRAVQERVARPGLIGSLANSRQDCTAAYKTCRRLVARKIRDHIGTIPASDRGYCRTAGARTLRLGSGLSGKTGVFDRHIPCRPRARHYRKACGAMAVGAPQFVIENKPGFGGNIATGGMAFQLLF